MGDWTLKQADSIADNTNWLVWQNGKTKQLSLWQLDDNWNYKKDYIYSDTQIEAYLIENTFNVDLNGDSIIGLDKNKNGIFDDDDLTGENLEQQGDIKTLKDINENLYAGSVSNPVYFSGGNAKVNSIDSVGWEILGVDTDKSTSINYMVIKEKATDLHALVDFGSDWNLSLIHI